jgi:hypothetical protein
MRRSGGYVIALWVIGALALQGLPGGCGPAGQPKSSPSIDASDAREPAIPNPTADAPVSAAAWIVPGSEARGSRGRGRGGAMELHVRARIAPGHYLHSTTAGPPFVATSAELESSTVIEPVGEWEQGI